MDQTKEYFLKQLADYLYKIHGQNIADLTIVFPNRRAGLFFTEYLNRIIKISTFSPEIITIQELFSNISSLRSEEQIQHIFRLFKIYKELSGSKETFDEFYLWGEMLLNDFDQVDKYLVDAELLFTNITDLKEIDEHFNDWNDDRKEEIRQFWTSLTVGEQKKDQKEFSRLWQVLFPIYKKLKEELSLEGIAYEGMLFRESVENQDNLFGVYLSERKFVVAGFNALNNCEKRLFQFLQSGKKIDFFWDFDHYYMDDLNQEAGLFMRENLELFPPVDFPFDTNCFKRSKNIQIFHSPSQIGQTQIASREIAKMALKTIDFHDTAIVLCDEELLLPVISAIPKEIETVNVTMGLPLKQTPLFSLISLLISLQRKAKRDGERLSFHYKSVSELLNNQFIQSIYPIECKLIVENIIKNNLLYIPVEDLSTNDLFKKIFIGKKAVSDLPDYFLSILFDLFLFWEKNKDYVFANNYQEYIYQVYLSVNKLNNSIFVKGKAIMGNDEFLSQDSFFKIMLQYLEALNITFEGEPLAGLQIMGILETRSLDFQNIVLLSVNEGIMPKANTSGSFIPYHLRKGVGLPTVEEQNAMYAYYFYRLLQRAETVTFIYNSGSNGLKTGEKSRFLHQLSLESPFNLSEEGIENTIDPVSTIPIIVEKKGRVLDMLNGFIESAKSMSPTALVQYVQCPLSYYFKYIARFEEEDEVVEEVDARIFGTLFHAVMEAIYRPYLKGVINEFVIKSLIENDELIENSLMEAFRTHFFKYQGASDYPVIAGRNKLVFEVIKKMVVQTLQIDSKKTPFKIEGLEQRVGANMAIFQGEKSVRVGGVIDRIDSISDSLEIIDYKTGTTDHHFNSLAELFDKESKKRNKAVFQTLIYCCIWDKMHQYSGPIFPGIYALKTIFKHDQTRILMKDNGNLEVNYQTIKADFEPLLTILLEEIFNPLIPFVQTNVEENCQYCAFASICGKPSPQS